MLFIAATAARPHHPKTRVTEDTVDPAAAESREANFVDLMDGVYNGGVTTHPADKEREKREREGSDYLDWAERFCPVSDTSDLAGLTLSPNSDLPSPYDKDGAKSNVVAPASQSVQSEATAHPSADSVLRNSAPKSRLSALADAMHEAVEAYRTVNKDGVDPKVLKEVATKGAIPALLVAAVGVVSALEARKRANSRASASTQDSPAAAAPEKKVEPVTTAASPPPEKKAETVTPAATSPAEKKAEPAKQAVDAAKPATAPTGEQSKEATNAVTEPSKSKAATEADPTAGPKRGPLGRLFHSVGSFCSGAGGALGGVLAGAAVATTLGATGVAPIALCAAGVVIGCKGGIDLFKKLFSAESFSKKLIDPERPFTSFLKSSLTAAGLFTPLGPLGACVGYGIGGAIQYIIPQRRAANTDQVEATSAPAAE